MSDLQASESVCLLWLQQLLLTKEFSENNKNIRQISSNLSVLSLRALFPRVLASTLDVKV